MTTKSPRPSARRFGWAGPALAVVSLGWLGVASGLPEEGGAVLAAAAIGIGLVLRSAPASSGREASWTPIAVGLGILAVVSPLTVLAELVAGLGGLAVIVWMIDSPDRLAGGIGRGGLALALPALAVGVAWASSFLLPPGVASVGIAAAVLALSLAALAFLLGRPDLFDRSGAATS